MRFRIYLALAGAFALLILALVIGGRARDEAQAISDYSFPAVRTLGDLREVLSQVQIALLERQTSDVTTPAPDADFMITRQLSRAGDLLDQHRSTVMTPRAAELCDQVRISFARYNAVALAFSGTAGSPSPPQDRQNLISVYHELQRELAVLREYRLGRAETRISEVEKGARRTQQTNLVAMLALLALILLTWLGSRVTDHDRH